MSQDSKRREEKHTSEEWIEITPDRRPPQGMVCITKIEDMQGERNVQMLKRQNNLYFYPDGSMYVYYTPTHFQQPKP